MLAAEELARLSSGCTCGHGSKAAGPTVRDARPSEETYADDGEFAEGNAAGRMVPHRPFCRSAHVRGMQLPREMTLGRDGYSTVSCSEPRRGFPVSGTPWPPSGTKIGSFTMTLAILAHAILGDNFS